MNQSFTLIINTLPPAFFRSLEEEIVAAFGQAFHTTKQIYEEPEQKTMLAQNRYALCETAFRQAATSNGLTVGASDTNPKGGMFSWAKLNGIFLLRGNINTHCGTPRSTKFRRQWAAINSWLSPSQYDFFRNTSEPSSDKLCAMLVVSAHKSQHGDPSLPAFIGIGIPSSDLSSWKALEPISNILALYHDRETEQQAPRETSIGVKDQAIPVLKKRPDGNGA